MNTILQGSREIDPGRPYARLHHDLKLLEQYVDTVPVVELNIPDQLPRLDRLKELLSQYRQKPNVALVGRFDSGKSHLANTLMGKKFLPSQYQPATRFITFVRHLEDRPSWFNHQVCILGQDFWVDENGNQKFNLTWLDFHSRYEKYCLKAGSLEVLRQHGIHNYLEEDEIGGYSAVVYVDSPILKACNIVDFPGYSDQAEQTSEDVKKANSVINLADIILYTAPTNGFMNAEDMSHLSYLLRALKLYETNCTEFPILGNLFIIATHALPHISEEQLKQILDVGSARLYKQINKTILEPRSELTTRLVKRENLRERFFAFWEETPSRWTSLRKEILLVLGEYLPKIFHSNINQEINKWKFEAPKNLSAYILSYEQTLSDVEQKRRELQQLEEEELDRKSRTEQEHKAIHQRITKLKQQTKNSFQMIYEELVNTSAVETMIREQYDNKKDAKEFAAGYLGEQLQGKLEVIMKENADSLKKDIDKFIGVYEEVFLKLCSFKGAVSIPFDPTGAFLGGLAGLGSVGALAIWAAALGNLGAYILVAKAVSLLAALGISISGGVATAVSFVAAIGGPITLAIGLVAIAALAGFALFGASWQHSLAKKLVSHFKEKQVIQQFFQGIDEYWDDTAKAFEHGANALEEGYQNYIQHLREVTSSDATSKERIEYILQELKRLKKIFANLTWKS